MKKSFVLLLGAVGVLSGCPAGSSEGGDNPKVAELQNYCPLKCLKFQECNAALFDLKWPSLELCEQECGKVAAANACAAGCDAQYAANPTESEKCSNYCRREVDVDACKAQCDGITEQSALTACLNGCDKVFSQDCADVIAAKHECYLNLTCERAVIWDGFGGSASDLGECTRDDDQIQYCGGVDD